MQSLDEIALKFGTDKNSLGHGYTAVYDSLLSPLRDKAITLLEIGVWEGASLAMWREYFKHALIVGVDVDMSRAREDYIDGTHIREGDATSEEFIRAAIHEFDGFDVVIDDGSHLAPLAVKSFALLWPWVHPGGWYFVEDIHTYYWPRANEPGSESWLFDLARDATGRGGSLQDGITHPTDIESVTFCQSLAIIQKTDVCKTNQD